MAQAAQQLIPVELELGGKDPMIVFDDAHTPRAIAGALWGGFTNAGQSCSGVERLLVHDRIFDRFLADLVAQAHKLVVHADDGGEADIGRMRSEEHTSELQSLMRISYAVFCLKKQTKNT